MPKIVKYEAVNQDQLWQRLHHTRKKFWGYKQGFVIGPDNNGKLDHLRTFPSMAEAKAFAKRCNNIQTAILGAAA